MNNFCVCNSGDYDFDVSDHDNYWMCDSAIVPEGTKCCECGASIPAGGRRSCATHYEVYEPEGEPRAPWDVGADEAMSDEDFDALETAFDKFQDENGWDCESERYVRETSTDFRCDRCEGEVEILAQFDICVNQPGDLPGAHEDHYWRAHRRRIRWRPGTDGVWNPQPWRLIDYARHYRKRAYWTLQAEYRWAFRKRLRRIFIWPVERVIAHAVHRERHRRFRWRSQTGQW